MATYQASLSPPPRDPESVRWDLAPNSTGRIGLGALKNEVGLLTLESPRNRLYGPCSGKVEVCSTGGRPTSYTVRRQQKPDDPCNLFQEFLLQNTSRSSGAGSLHGVKKVGICFLFGCFKQAHRRVQDFTPPKTVAAATKRMNVQMPWPLVCLFKVSA